ncbi:MAG: hypothetical protein U5M23_01480 [Marinagarivorans sp.]|nr:hypothetical protein [Marinagarivorans sp.]
MKNLIITAHTPAGFSAKFDWSISIDGILAYQVMRERLGDDEFYTTHGTPHMQKPVEGLPLDVDRQGGDWWYKCSRPFFETMAIHSTNHHRRFNSQECELYVHGKIAAIQTTKGPYKNARIAIQRFITPSVNWHVIGDEEEISRLLKSVTHIGAQRRAGMGFVSRWEVDCGGDENIATNLRAMPISIAQGRGLDGVIMEWAIRPPSQVPENIRACIIPINSYAG